jgi:hypothetical protein
MKRMTIAIFSLISVVELFASSQDKAQAKPYNNREIAASLKVVQKKEELTFAQQQVRKFLAKEDNYSKNASKK